MVRKGGGEVKEDTGKELLLSLLDDAKALLDKDYLHEKDGKLEYTVMLQGKESGGNVPGDDYRDCHSCPLWRSKVITPDLPFDQIDVLSVVALPSSPASLLTREEEEMYTKEMENVLKLGFSKRRLSSILKCYSDTFDEKYADLCKIHLRAEMAFLKPRLMILFGSDTARYMLKSRWHGKMDDVRKKVFNINGVETIATYSQKECISNPKLKKAVMEDLLFALEHLWK